MTSAVESGIGDLYVIAREAVYIRIILNEMGHKYPRTPVQTDNSTAEGVIKNKMKPKLTKAMHMRFQWLQYRQAQAQFRFHWRTSTLNYADYWTKHHPPTHHKHIQS